MITSLPSADACHLLIVSDNQLLAEATGEALQSESVINSYARLRTTDELPYVENPRQTSTCGLQIVLVDVDSYAEPSDLFSAVGRLVQEIPQSPIAAICCLDDLDCVTGCIEAGASGIVARTRSLAELIETLTALKQGQARCPSSVTEGVLARIRELSGAKHDTANNHDAGLTEREIEILELVDEGMLNKEISRQLGIAVSTVKNHLHSAFEKLRVATRRQAVRQAIALGVLHQTEQVT